MNFDHQQKLASVHGIEKNQPYVTISLNFNNPSICMKGSRFQTRSNPWTPRIVRLASPSAARLSPRLKAVPWHLKCWQHRWPNAVESYVDSGLVVGIQKLEGSKILELKNSIYIKIIESKTFF